MIPTSRPFDRAAAGLEPGDDMAEGYPLVWSATQTLHDGLHSQMTSVHRLLELGSNLSQILEDTRARYNQAVLERNRCYARLQEADNKLLQVDNVARRYAVVRNPVIASDGYTYEREPLLQYLEDCSECNSKAYSQQTKEELTDVVVPNFSLSRLVTLLKGGRTTELPPLTHRDPIQAIATRGYPISSIDKVGCDPSVGGGSSAAGAAGNTVPPAAKSALPNGTVHNLSSADGKAAGGHQGGGGGRRFEHGATGKHGGGKSSLNNGASKPALHPCLRVYGCCNFMEDCTFANYPYEACLNHIKGKCRFGKSCKELHVDPRDRRYQNTRSYAATHHHVNSHHAAKPSHAEAAEDTDAQPTGGNEAEAAEAASAVEAPTSEEVEATRSAASSKQSEASSSAEQR